MRNGQVFGALILGEKLGLTYLQEERELLTLFVRSVEILFEDTSPYRRLSMRRRRRWRVICRSAWSASLQSARSVAMNKRAEELLQLPAAKVLGGSVQKLGSAFADVVLRAMSRQESRFNEVIRDPVSKGQLSLNVSPGSPRRGHGGIPFPDGGSGPRRRKSRTAPFWEYLSTRVAQEIKNPMVAINTFAQLLPRKYESEDFRDAFSRVFNRKWSGSTGWWKPFRPRPQSQPAPATVRYQRNGALRPKFF